MNFKIINTDRLTLLPSDDSRDLDNYITHIENEDEDEFSFQYISPSWFIEVESISIFLKNTDIMIGCAGLFLHESDLECGRIELEIFKEYRRHHFGCEALKALIEIFFKGSFSGVQVKKIVAQTSGINKFSRKFLECAGFIKTNRCVHFMVDEYNTDIESEHRKRVCTNYIYELSVDEFQV